MPIPPDAVVWTQALDPSDKYPYVMRFGQWLTDGRVIQTFSINLLSAATALGLQILEDATHGPFIADDTNIKFWPQIQTAFRTDPAFDAPGALLPFEVTVTTSGAPNDVIQRTFVLPVKHQ